MIAVTVYDWHQRPGPLDTVVLFEAVTDEDGTHVIFGADRNASQGLSQALYEEGEARAEIEAWQMLGRF